MADYIIPEIPEYQETTQKLSTSDRNHADIFNRVYGVLFENDAFLKKVSDLAQAEINRAIAIALGRNQAIVFDTFEQLKVWFAAEENKEAVAALANGTNLYIIDTGVPDYWWSADNQQYYPLETQKADLSKYDNIIGAADIAALADGTITGALVAQNNNFALLNNNLNIKVDHYDADTKSLYLVSVEV